MCVYVCVCVCVCVCVYYTHTHIFVCKERSMKPYPLESASLRREFMRLHHVLSC